MGERPKKLLIRPFIPLMRLSMLPSTLLKSYIMWMETFLMASGTKIKPMALETTSTLMDPNMRDIGFMIYRIAPSSGLTFFKGCRFTRKASFEDSGTLFYHLNSRH